MNKDGSKVRAPSSTESKALIISFHKINCFIAHKKIHYKSSWFIKNICIIHFIKSIVLLPIRQLKFIINRPDDDFVSKKNKIIKKYQTDTLDLKKQVLDEKITSIDSPIVDFQEKLKDKNLCKDFEFADLIKELNNTENDKLGSL